MPFWAVFPKVFAVLDVLFAVYFFKATPKGQCIVLTCELYGGLQIVDLFHEVQKLLLHTCPDHKNVIFKGTFSE